MFNKFSHVKRNLAGLNEISVTRKSKIITDIHAVIYDSGLLMKGLTKNETIKLDNWHSFYYTEIIYFFKFLNFINAIKNYAT